MKGSSCFPSLSSPEGKAEKSIFSESIFTPDAVFSQNNRQLVFCSTPEESKKQLKGYHSRVSSKSRRETGKTRVMIIIYLLQHPLSFAVHLYNTVNQKKQLNFCKCKTLCKKPSVFTKTKKTFYIILSKIKD